MIKRIKSSVLKPIRIIIKLIKLLKSKGILTQQEVEQLYK